MSTLHKWTHDGDKVLLVKCLNRDGTTYNAFVWPEVGETVEAEHWESEPTCDGGGFFGWPWGIGIGDGRHADACAEWLVFAAAPEDVIAVDRKAKARRAQVVFRGRQHEVMAYTSEGRKAWTETTSDGSASAGEYGSASAGEYGSASAGWRGSASAGLYGNASAGPRGSASAGLWGSASAGYHGSASAGEYGSASTGLRGSASAGKGGSASADKGGVCVANVGGQVKVAKGAVGVIAYHEDEQTKAAVVIPGQDGIKADTWYECQDGKIVEVELGGGDESARS